MSDHPPKDIEARLERSLRRQLQAPRLDGRFDAAVWARIAAEQPRVAPRVVSRRGMPTWLLISNVLGIGVAVLLLVFSLLQSVQGVDLGIELSLPPPAEWHWQAWMEVGGQVIAAVAVFFGLTFTRYGRRLRSLMR